MQIRLYAQGGDFEGRPLLTAAVNLLMGLDRTASYCTTQAYIKYSSTKYHLPEPRIYLSELRQSSLDSLISCDIPQYAAMMAPVINSYSWELFSATFDYIKLAVEYFNSRGEPLVPRIDNSPSSMNLIVVNRGEIIINNSVLVAANKLHKDISGIADQIGSNGPDSIRFENIDDTSREVLDSFSIGRENCQLFKVNDVQQKGDDEIEVQCQVYKLNKKTKNGGIEILEDEGDAKIVQFTVDKTIEDLSDYVAAMSCKQSFLRGRPEYKVNALGESSLAHITATNVKNIK